MRARLLGTSLIAVAVAGVLGGGFLLATNAGGMAGSEPGVLASLVSRALSTPTTQVHIGGVDGALSSDATIRDVVISDRDGPWLRLDRARLVWRRSALFLRRLEIDDLQIGHLEIIRKPLPSEAPVKDADQPLLPELPVKVEVKQLALADLDLGKAVLGTALRASATGNTELGSPSEGLVFNLDATRLDSPGSFAAAVTYVPQGKALTVKVALDEPAGGLVSKIAHLPGEPPVAFHLAGNGTLDAFKGDLDFHAGPSIDAKGGITLTRRDAGRDLAVRVGGHLGALLPSLAASIFEGETDLVGDVRIGDDGAIALDDLALTSHLARLDAHGSFGADKTIDLAASVRAVPNHGEVSETGAGTIRKLELDASVRGPAKAPKIVAKLALADAHLPEGSLARLDAGFTATPSGEVTDAATRVALDGAVAASGLVPRDAALAGAIGDSATLSLHGSMDTQGAATFQRIEARTPTLMVTYAGDVSRARIRGRLGGEAPDLSRFGDLAGLRLAGRAALDVDLDAAPKRGTMNAGLSADVTGFSTGLAAVDRLAGRRLAVKGKLALADGRTTIEGLTVDGAHVAARVAGSVAPSTADLSAHVALPDLSEADPRLSGTGAFDAHLTGGLDTPDVSLAASVDRATAMGRAIPHLGLLATIADLRGAPSTRVTLDGTVDRKPATGHVAFARQGGGWNLSALDVTIGSIAVNGAGTVDAGHLARGAIALTAGNLDDLSPLALTKLGGSLSLDAAFATPDGAQSVRLAGKGSDLRAAGAALRHFALRADATDVYGRPVLDADATIDQALVGGQTISAVRFAAKGQATRSAVTLSARAAGFDLDAGRRAAAGRGDALRSRQLFRAPRHEEDRARRSRRPRARRRRRCHPPPRARHRRRPARRRGARRQDARPRNGRAGDPVGGRRYLRAGPRPRRYARRGRPACGCGDDADRPLSRHDPASRRASNQERRRAADRRRRHRQARRDTRQPRRQGLGRPRGHGDGHGLAAARPCRCVRSRRARQARCVGGQHHARAVGPHRHRHRARRRQARRHPRGAARRRRRDDERRHVPRCAARRTPRCHRGAARRQGRPHRHRAPVGDDAERRLAVGLGRGQGRSGGRLPGAGLAARAAGPAGRLQPDDRHRRSGDRCLGRARAQPAHRRPGRREPRRRRHPRSPADDIEADRRHRPCQRAAAGHRAAGTGRQDGTSEQGPEGSRRSVRGAARHHRRGAGPHLRARARRQRRARRRSPRDRHDRQAGAERRVRPAPRRDLGARQGLDLHQGQFDLHRRTHARARLRGRDPVERHHGADRGDRAGGGAGLRLHLDPVPAAGRDPLARVVPEAVRQPVRLSGAAARAGGGAILGGGGDDAFETMRKSLGLGSSDVGGGESSGPLGKLSRAIGDRVNIGIRTGATADQTGLAADIDVSKHVRVQSDVRSNGATSAGVGTELEY